MQDDNSSKTEPNYTPYVKGEETLGFKIKRHLLEADLKKDVLAVTVVVLAVRNRRLKNTNRELVKTVREVRNITESTLSDIQMLYTLHRFFNER